jgi:universal stress protein E
MDRLRQILVGIDFTPSSAAALSQALRLAGPAEGAASHTVSVPGPAQVVAAHIIETGMVIEIQEAYAPFVRDLPQSLIAEAKGRWQTFCPELPGKDSVRLEVSVGSPIAELTRHAQELQPDLIVGGTHGVSSDDAEGVGTLAAQLVRRIPAKVLLVRDSQTGPFTRIVACIDFSETSRRALVAAAAVAAHDGAELHILHVFRAPWKQVHWHSPTPEANPDFQKQYADALRRRLEDFVSPVADELRAEPGTRGSPVKLTIELFDSTSAGSGSIAAGYSAGINEYARRVGADLIVLGTHGRSNLRAFFLGSTAERLLRHASCSVLAVPPAAE